MKKTLPESLSETSIDRDLSTFQRSTLDRATSAKLKVENFYKNLSQQAIEREERYERLRNLIVSSRSVYQQCFVTICM